MKEEMPERMRGLGRDGAGRVVPWFVHVAEDGEPDFRVIGAGKIEEAYLKGKCWVCGEKLGVFKAFVIGPMCTVNRTSGEPPSHRDCARYSAHVCPFLTTPRMKRRERDLPSEVLEPGGVMIKRNPGVTVVWVTKSFARVEDDNGGSVFRIGPAESVEFFCEGREASRAEIMESFDSGLPILMEIAREEGTKAVAALERMYFKALQLVPAL